jgi:transcriptional regulator with XRE-family HTH domain
MIYNHTPVIFLFLLTLSVMMQKDKILSRFARRLTSLREKQGISIRELASRSNLEYSQVQRIEKGKVNFAYSTLLALAEGLNISPSELLDF